MATHSEAEKQNKIRTTSWIIKEILHQSKEDFDHYAKESFMSRFEFNVPNEEDGTPNYYEQISALFELEKSGAIKILEINDILTRSKRAIERVSNYSLPFEKPDNHVFLFSTIGQASLEIENGNIPLSAKIEILQPQFEKLKETISKDLKQLKIGKEKNKKNIALRHIKDNYLVFGSKQIPIERGQKSMVIKFLENAEIFRKKKLVRRGIKLEIKELIISGGYADDGAFRDGLKRLKRKIKNIGLPVTIKNYRIGKYQMIINYY